MIRARPLIALRQPELLFGAAPSAAASRAGGISGAVVDLTLSLYDRLHAAEPQWRAFEATADCTPFQTFDWLVAWQRHIGACAQTQPVIAVAAFADGRVAMMLPLAVAGRAVRRLSWLGQELNDYNAPLLAPDFSQRVTQVQFAALWNELRTHMGRDQLFRHDWVELEKMPARIGAQVNPFCALAVSENPSGAHCAQLGSDWTKFYADRRSAATRRHDRAKRKRLALFGEVEFVTSTDADDARRVLDVLIEQKRRVLARRGIPDFFARPGWREFFLDLAGKVSSADAGIHISSIRVGELCAAANLGIMFRGTYYHLLTSYDDGEVSKYGPGALHLRELLAYAIERRQRRFDFTIGDEPYKLEWSDIHARLYDHAAPATWRGLPAWCRSGPRRTLRRLIKQTPWLWRLACRVRTWSARAPRRQAPAR